MKKKFRITIEVEGDIELRNDLEDGHVREGIETDVFPQEKVTSFVFQEIEN